jgi:HD-like signal output (HDOD) protein
MLSREERLLAAAHYLATRDQFPVFPRHAHEVITASDGDDQAIEHVVDVVSQSVGLSVLVLREANMAASIRNGRRVSTVRRAVNTLGLWNLRDLASSLAGSEAFHRHPPAVRDLIMQSTLTSMTARKIAEKCEPEAVGEAQVCGMFRSCGELLIACFLPELHEEIRMRVAAGQETEEAVCMDVLQFTYDEVGQRVARLWNWPEHMTRALRAKRPLAIVSGVGDFLHTVTGCAHGLVEASRSVAASAEVERIADQYAHSLELSVDQFQDVLRDGYEDTMTLWAAARVPMDIKQLRRQMELAVGPSRPAKTPVEPEPLPSMTALVEAVEEPAEAPAFAFPQPANAPRIVRY